MYPEGAPTNPSASVTLVLATAVIDFPAKFIRTNLKYKYMLAFPSPAYTELHELLATVINFYESH